MKEIQLTKGMVALVDDDDYEWLNGWKWHAQRCGDKWYASRATGGRLLRKHLYMHRAILDAAEDIQVDHVNQQGLDNQRSNLRLATKSQNMINRGPQKNNTSGYKGVYWDKNAGRWLAQIKIDRKVKHLGYFDSVEDAARAYDEGDRLYFGEFAWTNF